jgi:hypothetical protein
MTPNFRVGQYVLERPLGDGGMAEVWLARNVHLGTPAAIKFLNPAFAGRSDVEQRFLNEGRRQGLLNHPNIVKVYGFEYVDNHSFLILQYIDGYALDQLLLRTGALDPSEVIRIATGVLNALECAHKSNIVHRDIKPSNILLDASGHPYLGDFGIVLAMNEQRITSAGTVMGTAHYMSPEQINSPSTLDHRSDIYSFGCVLYEMFTGQPPFYVPGGDDRCDTDFAAKLAHVQLTPQPLRQRNPAINPQIDQVVMRCLAKNPEHRYSTCPELRDALTAAVAYKPASSRGKPRWPFAVAAAVGALVIAIVLFLVLKPGPAPAPPPAFAVDSVSICRGAYNASTSSCETDALSKQLNVIARFHAAKPGQTILRAEWDFNGTATPATPSETLNQSDGIFYSPYPNPASPGDYKATVLANGSPSGSATVHINAEVVPPPPLPPPPQPDTTETDVRNLLDKWTWSLKRHDLDEHMSCYAAVVDRYFGRANATNDFIRQTKLRAFNKYSDMEASIAGLQIVPVAPDRVETNFTKTFRFTGPNVSTFAATTRSKLILSKFSAGWKITSEEDLQVVR